MAPGILDPAATTRTPPPALRLDLPALSAFLARSVPGFPSTPDLTAAQFAHGQSNPTYLLTAGGGAWRAVLRKRPPGRTLPSAHAVEREAAVLTGLAGSAVPAPALLAACDDASILGTPFYVMAYVPGVVPADPALPSLPPATRAGVYRAAAATLAAVHAVDVASAPGLAGLARQGSAGYAARQVATWDRQFRAAQASGPGGGRAADPSSSSPSSSSPYAAAAAAPLMARLAAWLAANVPPSDATTPPTLVHGDYRLDNLIFDAATLQAGGSATPSPTVAAVLDWELATLGHPLSDLAYACLPYHLPPGVPALPALPRPLPPGIPTEAEFVASYWAAKGAAAPAPAPPTTTTTTTRLEWAFFVALSLFRAASILAGVGARAAAGNAASAHAASVGSDAVVAALAGRALAVIEEAGGGGRAAAPQPHASSSSSSPGLGPSPRAAALLARLKTFMTDAVEPADAAVTSHAESDARWGVAPEVEALKAAAIQAGLWNLWLPAGLASRIRGAVGGLSPPPLLPPGFASWDALLGPGLTNLEYAHLAAEMGRIPWSAEAFNCSAPDTGNMEVLARFASPGQVVEWLVPLLAGTWRSCFAMTEPGVASSDATNIAATVRVVDGGGGGAGRRRGAERRLIIDGDKWWTSGALDPRTRLCLVMATGGVPEGAPPHARHSVIAVPMPSPGLTVGRALTVFGYDDAPHGHAAVSFRGVTVPLSHALPGLGRGFEVGQARLGPGRLHHCMRLVGMGDAGLAAAWARARSRVAFGKPLADQGSVRARLAAARVRLEGARLLVLHAAAALDAAGGDARAVRGALAAAKVAAPAAALAALDAAIQVHGGAGVSGDTPLARLWAGARTLRLADGPDEVHLETLARLEEKRGGGARARL